MTDLRKNPEPKITLEEILRLKRKETPPPEFWERFDREFRRKTLQALVEEKFSYRRYLYHSWGWFWKATPGACAALLTLAFIFSYNHNPLPDKKSPLAFGPQSTVSKKSRETVPNNPDGVPIKEISSITDPEKNFVIDVIPRLSHTPHSFEKVMHPHTFTPSLPSGFVYMPDPMESPPPTLQFVSVPSLDHF